MYFWIVIYIMSARKIILWMSMSFHVLACFNCCVVNNVPVKIKRLVTNKTIIMKEPIKSILIYFF
jgi:hypothetical protein